jgi:hypothetical protein
MATSLSSVQGGVYGLRLTGVPKAARLLPPVAPNAPVLTVKRHVDRACALETMLDERRAQLPLQGGGWVTIERRALHARFALHTPASDEEMVHPYLSSAAAVISRWLGRDPFHGGAFLLDSGAWAILAEKEQGKSSTLAYLATRGMPILADDLVVIDERTLLAGPGCIDLRPDAARRLGVGENLGVIGVRERWRLVVPSHVGHATLRGWIMPAWGPHEIVSLAPTQRLAALLPHLTVRVRPLIRPERLLELASLPCYVFRRPRSWEGIETAVDRLLDVVSS